MEGQLPRVWGKMEKGRKEKSSRLENKTLGARICYSLDMECAPKGFHVEGWILRAAMFKGEHQRLWGS